MMSTRVFILAFLLVITDVETCLQGGLEGFGITEWSKEADVSSRVVRPNMHTTPKKRENSDVF